MFYEAGNKVKLRLFGASHAKEVGGVLSGIPAGVPIDEEELAAFMHRRRPGFSVYSSSRKEPDEVVIERGINGGFTTGEPIEISIRNMDARGEDYESENVLARPSHSDYTSYLKYGKIYPGSGFFSGRMTAPMCACGGIALQLLSKRNIYIGSHLLSVGNVRDEAFPLFPDKELFDEIHFKEIPTISNEAQEQMKEAIMSALKEKDSLGGVIECCAVNVPNCLGEPLFGGLEGRLSSFLFGIPALKGVEFGSGFYGSSVKGSENNDEFIIKNGKIITSTNNSGGILGGITNGMPLLFRAAIKPTPTIGKVQKTVDLKKHIQTELISTGRHDPCAALRANSAVEALCAICLCDIIAEEEKWS